MDSQGIKVSNSIISKALKAIKYAFKTKYWNNDFQY